MHMSHLSHVAGAHRPWIIEKKNKTKQKKTLKAHIRYLHVATLFFKCMQIA